MKCGIGLLAMLKRLVLKGKRNIMLLLHVSPLHMLLLLLRLLLLRPRLLMVMMVLRLLIGWMLEIMACRGGANAGLVVHQIHANCCSRGNGRLAGRAALRALQTIGATICTALTRIHWARAERPGRPQRAHQVGRRKVGVRRKHPIVGAQS